MTKEEVEKLFEEEKATTDSFSRSDTPCNYCKIPRTGMILTSRYHELFSVIVYILENGFYEWVPFEINRTTTTGVEITKREGIAFLKDAFCSKRCFTDYMYEHQSELLEGITQ